MKDGQSVNYAIAFPADLYEEIKRTAHQTNLSIADAIRQGVKLGLAPLRESLAPINRITNVDPLPKSVLEKLYRDRDDDLDTTRRFIAAQPKDAE